MANNKKTNDSAQTATAQEASKARNAWLIHQGDEARLQGFSVTVDHCSSLFRGVVEGDGVLIAGGDPSGAVAFARVYRIGAKLDKTTFFFDGVLPVDGYRLLAEFGVTIPETKAAMLRLEWPVFEAALKAACGIAFDALPVLSGESAEEQAYVRKLLQLAVIDDLMGPADGPVEEIVGMSVRDRYLVGKLAPMDTIVGQEQVEEFGESGQNDIDEQGKEVDASLINGVHLLCRRIT
jgi:hypothetical protein